MKPVPHSKRLLILGPWQSFPTNCVDEVHEPVGTYGVVPNFLSEATVINVLRNYYNDLVRDLDFPKN